MELEAIKQQEKIQEAKRKAKKEAYKRMLMLENIEKERATSAQIEAE